MKNEVSFTSELAKFGIALFETIKIFRGNAIFLEEHLDRLYNSLSKLKIDFSLNQKRLTEEINDYIKDLNEKALRVTVFDEGYNFSLRDIPYHREDYRKGFRLKLAAVKRGESFIYQYKTANYLENIYLKREAKESGYDEALIVNTEDKILEGTMTNIFFIQNEKIYTPSSELPLLPGITRAKVIEVFKKLDIELLIGEIDLNDISDFDFVFITNSLMGLMKVVEIEGINYEKENKLFDEINNGFGFNNIFT